MEHSIFRPAILMHANVVSGAIEMSNIPIDLKPTHIGHDSVARRVLSILTDNFVLGLYVVQIFISVLTYWRVIWSAYPSKFSFCKYVPKTKQVL